jgi:pyridoxine/pyridoxamine 5'-phosphate oxidase
MEENILAPKYLKKKKPVKVRKPSRPIDGINHRLMAEQVTQVLETVAVEVSAVPDENAAPTRIELIEKAKELGLTFTKRTSDEKLLAMITEALSKQEA